MINQNSIEKVHQDFRLDWMDAARLRTIVKEMTMPPISFKGRKTRKTARRMSTAYFVEQLVKEAVKDTPPDDESMKWMNEMKARAEKRRKIQDEKVRNGVNRKPKSEWKKPGRIAGKVYPKYVEAMKRIAERRRAQKLNSNNSPTADA